jgi:hypothetical protein
MSMSVLMADTTVRLAKSVATLLVLTIASIRVLGVSVKQLTARVLVIVSFSYLEFNENGHLFHIQIAIIITPG